MSKSQTEIQSVLTNYDALMEQAQNSAKNQLEYIVSQISLTDREVIIEFTEEGDNGE